METKKTKLTISGKPRKNLYDNQGLTNNKKKQKFVTEKKFSKPFNKNNPGSSKFPKKPFQVNHLFHQNRENHLSPQKLAIMKEENLRSREQLKK